MALWNGGDQVGGLRQSQRRRTPSRRWRLPPMPALTDPGFRQPVEVFQDVRAMRELIAQEKGDDELWDLKLARGGLMDLDFMAQGLVLSHAHAHSSLVGLSTEVTFARAEAAGLLPEVDARTLAEAHKLFNDIFQWQHLTIEGKFDVEAVPLAILKRLASVADLPSAMVLSQHLDAIRAHVVAISEVVAM